MGWKGAEMERTTMTKRYINTVNMFLPLVTGLKAENDQKKTFKLFQNSAMIAATM